MGLTPQRAAAMGAEALRICEEGAYRTATGETVQIGPQIERARAGSVSYPPDHDVPRPGPSDRETLVEVENQATLAAARRFVDEGRRPVVLNFASAHVPGGGFLDGSRAQEESLCWSSALFACLVGNAMYAFHGDRDDDLYTDYVLHAPDVPVFRDDDGALLDAPWFCSFLTSPAVYAGQVLAADPSRADAIREAMRSRIDKVLAVAAHHEHDALVLGAWGCGVFGNDAREVAGLFREALDGPFAGVFEHVVFAVLDRSETKPTFRTFCDVLGDPPEGRR